MKTSFFKTFLLFAALTFAGASFAQKTPPPKSQKQQKQQKQQDIDAMKIAFITKELQLTPEEAQQFWPVYNQYTEKVQDLCKKRKQEVKDTKTNMDKLSDKEVEQAVDNYIAARQKELDVQKEYEVKIKAILPIRKVAKLYDAEEQFKRMLLNKLKDTPDGPPPPAPKE